MCVHIFSYLANKLEIRWVYLSQLKCVAKAIMMMSRPTSMGYNVLPISSVV